MNVYCCTYTLKLPRTVTAKKKRQKKKEKSELNQNVRRHKHHDAS